MFEAKPLSEVNYNDLEEFLALRRAEGEDLDYKQAWDDKIVRDVSAMANTAGGDLLVGVQEERDEREKTNRPDPDDVPGVDRRPGFAAAIMAKVRSRTRPPVVPEVAAIEIPGRPDKVVLAVRVAESPDAPHEVRHGPSPEILVRRRDNTESAGVDDVERLIRRRDAARGQGAEEIDLDFFEGRVALPDNDRPPVLALWARPRMLASLNFAFDHAADRGMRGLFLEHTNADTVEVRPLPHGGLALEGLEEGTPSSRLEISAHGTIRGAQALQTVAPDGLGGYTDVPSEDEPGPGALAFGEIARAALGMARFAAAAYATRRSGVEIEAWYGLNRHQMLGIVIPVSSPYRSYRGRGPSGGLDHQPVYQGVVMRTRSETGWPLEEDLLGLVRALSRAAGISAPDERLVRYLHGPTS